MVNCEHVINSCAIDVWEFGMVDQRDGFIICTSRYDPTDKIRPNNLWKLREVKINSTHRYLTNAEKLHMLTQLVHQNYHKCILSWRADSYLVNNLSYMFAIYVDTQLLYIYRKRSVVLIGRRRKRCTNYSINKTISHVYMISQKFIIIFNYRT